MALKYQDVQPRLRHVGQRCVSEGQKQSHADFLNSWTAHRTSAPFATNFHVRVPPALKEVRFRSEIHTATRVFQRSDTWDLGLRAPVPVHLNGAAGSLSGMCDRDAGKLGALNAR